MRSPPSPKVLIKSQIKGSLQVRYFRKRYEGTTANLTEAYKYPRKQAEALLAANPNPALSIMEVPQS